MFDPRYTLGVDLGQTRNHTALVVLETSWVPGTARDFISSGSTGYIGHYRHLIVGAQRISLGTPYPRVVSWVKSVAQEIGLSKVAAIVVDATGLGSVVMDLMRRAQMGARLVGVSITSTGSGLGTTSGGFRSLSRTELLTKLQIAAQEERFQIDTAKCRDWPALRRELSQVRLSGRAPGQQDDLAFALALAVWWSIR